MRILGMIVREQMALIVRAARGQYRHRSGKCRNLQTSLHASPIISILEFVQLRNRKAKSSEVHADIDDAARRCELARVDCGVLTQSRIVQFVQRQKCDAIGGAPICCVSCEERRCALPADVDASLPSCVVDQPLSDYRAFR